MNKQQILIIAASFLIGVSVGYFSFQSSPTKENLTCPQITQKDCVAISTPMSEWETFVNTKYGYEVRVPKKAFIRGVTVPPNIHEASELAFSGEGGDFSIAAGSLAMAKDMETVEKIKALSVLDLRTYAVAVRDLELDSPNQKISPRAQVGEIEEIQFADSRAYRFVLSKPYWWLYHGEVKSDFWHVIVAENLRGQKIIIGYPVNDASEKMVQSIKFSK